MMLKHDCNYDCNLNHCPFVQDTRNPNRYVCLKCGVDRQIDRPFSLATILLVMLGLLLFFQVLTPPKQKPPQLKPNSATYSAIK
ncbi:hypothetical protein [Fortiea contorta]|uniref:hypothetical protein n=1 Tax=Fortiea contorta TaxID=1892405 RepID=UPI0012B58170|nr:hypothetical protein [Fortiea contorta]